VRRASWGSVQQAHPRVREAVNVRRRVPLEEGRHGVEGVAGVAEPRLLGGPVEEV
jgi:hypothetical protein